MDNNYILAVSVVVCEGLQGKSSCLREHSLPAHNGIIFSELDFQYFLKYLHVFDFNPTERDIENW